MAKSDRSSLALAEESSQASGDKETPPLTRWDDYVIMTIIMNLNVIYLLVYSDKALKRDYKIEAFYPRLA